MGWIAGTFLQESTVCQNVHDLIMEIGGTVASAFVPSKGVTPFSLQWDAFGLGMDSWWSNTKGCTTGFKIRWNPIVPFRAQVFGTVGI